MASSSSAAASNPLVDGQAEFLVEAKRPAHFDLLRHQHILRDRNITAEAKLNQDAARLEHLEPRANGPFVARRFEMNIKKALIGRIDPELIWVVGDIDGRSASWLRAPCQRRRVSRGAVRTSVTANAPLRAISFEMFPWGNIACRLAPWFASGLGTPGINSLP